MVFMNHFEKPNIQHPEIEDPETVLPADQGTKQKLKDVVAAHFPDSVVLGESMSAFPLVDPRDGSKIEMMTGMLADINPEAIARVRFEEPAGAEELKHTDYFINDTPDGLELEKHIHIDPKPVGAGALINADASQIRRMFNGEFKRIDQQAETDDYLRELGMGFVSQKEATDLD